MIKKFKNLTPLAKSFLILIGILTIGIIIRWSQIKEDIKRSFGFFKSDTEQVDSTKNNP